MEHFQRNTGINILLADDDMDERYFFEVAIMALPIAVNIKTVNDGVFLMNFLNEDWNNIPDILFLDINMPRKNGIECLTEIKGSERLKHLPVIIYSTAGSDEYISIYYQYGAIKFVEKGNYSTLTKRINSSIEEVAGGMLKPHKER